MLTLIKEEKTTVEPSPAQPAAPSQDAVDPKVVAVACEESVNTLMQQAWDFISNIKSVIATLDVNYIGDSKKDILELLNTIVDDSTINVGVLQKITDLMNSKRVDLLDAGADKAEAILTKEADSE